MQVCGITEHLIGKQHLDVKLQPAEPQCRLRMLNGVRVTTLTYSSKPCNHNQ